MIAPTDDIDRIMAVMQAAFDPAYGEAWSRRQVEDALLVGNSHYRIADVLDEPAGFTLSRYGFEEEELLLIAVAPDFRRRGLGEQLLRDCKADAKLRGARQLLLEMRSDNPAVHLYRQNGFVEIGTRKNYYRTPSGNRLDAITFACQL
ncbi:MAG: ribosomal protein S18-alanine N-acetyltransferase [Novosphingobium sp.]|jgi:ribosomal-protein-alanine N-acetyltransferase